MNLRKKLLMWGLSAATCVSGVQAQNFTTTISPFSTATDLTLLDASTDYRFGKFVETVLDQDNQTTHLLVQGLTPVADSDTIYAGPYDAVDINTGAIQDTGYLYMTIPAQAALPEGTVASPIVAVFERNNAWSSYNVVESSPTTLGGASGGCTYDSNAGTVSLTVTRGSDTFTGTTNYTTSDKNSLSLDALSLTDGGTTYDFQAANFQRDNTRFYGILETADTEAEVGYESLLFNVELKGFTDTDNDAIPDISDETIGGPVEVVIGDWRFDDRIGWVNGNDPNWTWTINLGWVYLADFPWIFHDEIGWMYFVGRIDDSQAWYWHPTLGYLYAYEPFTGWYQVSPYDGAPENYDNFLPGVGSE